FLTFFNPVSNPIAYLRGFVGRSLGNVFGYKTFGHGSRHSIANGCAQRALSFSNVSAIDLRMAS
ncbi:MAG: hypothetical protein R6V38_04400, partial [Roseovarius gahaiensis]